MDNSVACSPWPAIHSACAAASSTPPPSRPPPRSRSVCAADYNDLSHLDAFLAGLEAVTYEFENVPLPLAEALAQRAAIVPSARRPRPPVRTASPRRPCFASSACRRPLSWPSTIGPASSAALAEIGTPALLKTRRFGYDGKGQFPLRSPDDLDAAWDALGGVPLVLEGWVSFRRELSLIAVRATDGTIAFYPLVENHHADGMLRLTLAPAPGLTPHLQEQAEQMVRAVLEDLAYVGVLTVEFFEVNGQLVANEMAPRVHNSGHWTIEGAETSQFENHLRAVLGWPLGSTVLSAPCAMLNLIGTLPPTAAVLAVPGAHLHLYGKTPREGRKLGHITLRGQGPLHERLRRLQALLP